MAAVGFGGRAETSGVATAHSLQAYGCRHTGFTAPGWQPSKHNTESRHCSILIINDPVSGSCQTAATVRLPAPDRRPLPRLSCQVSALRINFHPPLSPRRLRPLFALQNIFSMWRYRNKGPLSKPGRSKSSRKKEAAWRAVRLHSSTLPPANKLSLSASRVNDHRTADC